MAGPLSINSNISSSRVRKALSESSTRISRSLERLSSGLRINRPSDDAAGLSMASRLGLDSRVYGQAVRNANDGISALSIAEGATSELTSIVGRLKELATQSANGALGLAQRRSLQAEANALTNEYNRLIQTTRFNNRALLNGDTSQMGLQLGYGSNGYLNLNIDSGLRRNVGTLTYGNTNTSLINVSNGSVTGDFNGDGKIDVVLAGDSLGTGALQLYRGLGTGSFGAGVNVANGAVSTGSVYAADLNNDGSLDLLSLSEGATSTVLVNLNNGDGTFKSTITVSTGVNSLTKLVAGDVNADGRADIVVASSANGAKVMLGNGDGTFSSGQAIVSGIQVSDVAIGDINGDSVKDIIAGNGTNLLTFAGSGGGTFGNAISYAMNASTLEVADLNRDGNDDVVIGGGAVYTYHGQSDGTLGTGTGIFAAGLYPKIHLKDMNNDGYLDIVGGGGITSIGLGNGDGTFNSSSATVSIDPDEVNDFNGDGVLDFLDQNGVDEMYTTLGVTTQSTTLEAINIASRENALAALSTLDVAFSRLSLEAGVLGASLSRLQSGINVLDAAKENIDSSRSRIVDADVAEETANLLREQIRQNASVALLAQANQQPQIALSLLQAA